MSWSRKHRGMAVSISLDAMCVGNGGGAVGLQQLQHPPTFLTCGDKHLTTYAAPTGVARALRRDDSKRDPRTHVHREDGDPCVKQVRALSSMGMTASVDEISLIKSSLLQVAAMTERGQLASPDQRNDVDILVDRLEALKMEGPDYNDEDMVGVWTLVYSSSQAFRSSPFFATFQALLGQEGVAEKIFSFTDGFPNAKIGQARQIVNEDCTELVSRVEMSLWPHRWISGVVETRSRIVNDDIGERLEVIVDDTRVKDSILGKISPRLEGWRVPVDQLSERIFDRIPRIALETIFLDQDLRISRLPDRNFLVYVKDY